MKKKNGNPKKPKRTKPSSLIVYKALTVRETFTDMKDMKDKVKSSEFMSCFKFAGRCEKLLETGQFDTE